MNIDCNPSSRLGLFRSVCRLARVSLAFGILLLFALSAQARDYPVIFIHGINSNAEDSWGKFRNVLVANTWTYGGSPFYDASSNTVRVYKTDTNETIPLTYADAGPGDFYTLNFSNNHNLTFPEQGAELAKVISAVLAANPPKNKVILVAHSMGGLAARAYLQGQTGTVFRDDVQQLVTVGTPHQGSMMAAKCISNPLCLGLGSIAGWGSPFNLYPDSLAMSALVPANSVLVPPSNS